MKLEGKKILFDKMKCEWYTTHHSETTLLVPTCSSLRELLNTCGMAFHHTSYDNDTNKSALSSMALWTEVDGVFLLIAETKKQVLFFFLHRIHQKYISSPEVSIYSQLSPSRICWDWRNSFNLEKIQLMRS